MTHYNANMKPNVTYTRINGRLAHQYVSKCKPFKNSNGQLYGHWEAGGVAYSDGGGMRYVVYSYGKHWPLFVWDDESQCWYGNSDKNSVTTTKHRTYANPSRAVASTIHWLPLEAIRLLAREGYGALAAARMQGVTFD
jgi:hypothetical protein